MNKVYEFAIRMQDLVSPTLQRLSKQYSSTVSKMQGMSGRLSGMFRGATQSVEELRKKLEQLKGKRDLSIDTRQIKAANREIDVLQKKIDKLEGKKSNGGLMSSLMQQAAPYAGAAMVVAGAAYLGNAGIQREQTQMAYEQFTRDPAIARKLIAEQNHFADVTPFTNDEVMGAGRSMLAYGFKANDVVHQESMVGDVAAGVQTNFGELAGVYGKLKSKGFADTSDIWQFADRGIPILDALSKSLGKSKEEILKMAETRQIKFTDIEKAFETMTTKGGMFEGMLEKMSKSTGGKLSTFIGTVQNKFATLAETLNPLISLLLEAGNGLFSALDPVFSAIGNLFSAFEPLFHAIGRLLELFGLSGEQAGVLTILVNILAGAINAVAMVVNILSSAIDFLTNNAFSAYLIVGALVVLNLGTIVGWVISLVGWLTTAFTWVISFAEAWWAANAAILACPIVWIVAAIAALVAGIVWAWNNVEGFRNALIRLWEVAKAVFGSIGKAWDAMLKGDFSGMIGAFSDAVKSGLANAEVRIKAENAQRAVGNAPKVPTAPTLAKPEMPGKPGDGKAGKDKKDKVGKAAGLDATTGGTKSTTITINIKSLVERLNINAGTVGAGIKDMEGQVIDAMLRVANSANAMGN